MLLAFASLTDPVTASAAPVLKALHREFGSEVAFVTVYVREAHPGDRIPQPRKAEWKMHHAKRLQARDAIPWTVAVDDLDGTLHRSLGGHGASAHLLDPNGNVAFQALFSSDGAALREALFAVARGVAGGHPSSSERKLVPALRALGRYDDVVRAAGPRALCDLRQRGAAPLRRRGAGVGVARAHAARPRRARGRRCGGRGGGRRRGDPGDAPPARVARDAAARGARDQRPLWKASGPPRTMPACRASGRSSPTSTTRSTPGWTTSSRASRRWWPRSPRRPACRASGSSSR